MAYRNAFFELLHNERGDDVIPKISAYFLFCREILDRYGNMASATVLFVLDKVRKDNAGRTDKPWTLALAFGPGISVEGAFMRLVA